MVKNYHLFSKPCLCFASFFFSKFLPHFPSNFYKYVGKCHLLSLSQFFLERKITSFDNNQMTESWWSKNSFFSSYLSVMISAFWKCEKHAVLWLSRTRLFSFLSIHSPDSLSLFSFLVPLLLPSIFIGFACSLIRLWIHRVSLLSVSVQTQTRRPDFDFFAASRSRPCSA